MKDVTIIYSLLNTDNFSEIKFNKKNIIIFNRNENFFKKLKDSLDKIETNFIIIKFGLASYQLDYNVYLSKDVDIYSVSNKNSFEIDNFIINKKVIKKFIEKTDLSKDYTNYDLLLIKFFYENYKIVNLNFNMKIYKNSEVKSISQSKNFNDFKNFYERLSYTSKILKLEKNSILIDLIKYIAYYVKIQYQSECCDLILNDYDISSKDAIKNILLKDAKVSYIIERYLYKLFLYKRIENKNPVLTIGILFCDKDVKYISNLVESLYFKINIPFEVILVDNRINNKEQISFKESNIRIANLNIKTQFTSRKYIANNAIGKYIWYVDADDYILSNSINSDEIFNKNYDIILFGFEKISKNMVNKVNKNEIMEINKYMEYNNNINSFDINNLKKIITGQLWNKFIKTNILKKVYNKVSKEISLQFQEDMIINDTLLLNNYVKNIKFLNDILYCYCNFESFISNKNNISFEEFKKYFNLKNYFYVINKLQNKKNEKFRYYSKKDDLSDALFCLSRAYYLVKKEDFAKCEDYVISYYGDIADIIDSLGKYFFNNRGDYYNFKELYKKYITKIDYKCENFVSAIVFLSDKNLNFLNRFLKSMNIVKIKNDTIIVLNDTIINNQYYMNKLIKITNRYKNIKIFNNLKDVKIDGNYFWIPNISLSINTNLYDNINGQDIVCYSSYKDNSNYVVFSKDFIASKEMKYSTLMFISKLNQYFFKTSKYKNIIYEFNIFKNEYIKINAIKKAKSILFNKMLLNTIDDSYDFNDTLQPLDIIQLKGLKKSMKMKKYYFLLVIKTLLLYKNSSFLKKIGIDKKDLYKFFKKNEMTVSFMLNTNIEYIEKIFELIR